MTDMIERVARAIADAERNRRPSMAEPFAETLARAAIEAMREPTSNQLDAGYAAISERQCDDDLAFGWRAMIDEALRENNER